MTFISKYAIAIQSFLSSLISDARGEKFKIFIRPEFQLDAYLFVLNPQRFSSIEKLFDEFCKTHEDFSDIAAIENNSNIQIFFNVLSISELEDSFYSNVVNNPNNIDYGPRYRFDSLLTQGKTEKSAKLFNKKDFPPIITFYSYKGGMGRTTTMFSYALHLAKKEKKVLIIDCDLEAPGYLNFFGLSENTQLKKGIKNGLVEFLCDTQFLGEIKDKDIENYILDFAQDEDKEKDSANSETQKRLSIRHREIQNIWVMPAGNLNDGVKEGIKSRSRQDYLEGLAKLNLGNTQNVANGFISLFKLLKSWKFDAILIDSRTGFNDIFGTAAFYLSSCVVGFFGLSRQTEPGFVNLLAEHSQHKDIFKLILAFSILPNDVQDISRDMQGFIDGAYPTEPPVKRLIHRNAILEKVGTGDDEADEKFIEMSTTSEKDLQFSDYSRLFEEIDNVCFHKGLKVRLMKGWSTRPNCKRSDSGNTVLKHLKKVLDESTSIAEDSAINESTFLYRKCMSDFFNKDKLIICGRKGTGKTHLCKALQNKRVLDSIKNMSPRNDDAEYIFVNALPDNRNREVFLPITIKTAFPKGTDYLNLWRIYTWCKLLLDDSIEGLSEIRSVVKQRSPLADKYFSINGELDTSSFIELAYDVDNLLQIVGDLQRFDDELARNNKKVFILYDNLNSYIPVDYWEKTAQSLFEYWTHSGIYLNNIAPKIFIRTDLFTPSIQNSITGLSPNNIISMEWSTEEVFSYFFKLIFSDPVASSAYQDIAKDFGIDSQLIDSTVKHLETSNNQFSLLSQAEIEPLLQVVFGKDTNGLGRPWDYFKKELSNADYTTNLQLFINTLNRNAVDKALANAAFNITEIINPRIYTSGYVRAIAAKKLFGDLVKDPYCKALAEFQYVVLSAENGKYRYKSLDENKFEELINETTSQIDSSDYGHKKEDLINMIFANGIMTANQTTKGKSFVFAPLYWFPWGLRDDEEDPDLKKVENLGKFIKDVGNSAIGAGLKEFGTAATAVGSAVSMASEIAKMISKLSNKK